METSVEHPCKCDICYGARDAEIARLRNAEHLRFTDARKDVAIWMIANGVATGHGDTLDDLLRTLVAHCAERALRVTANRYGEKSEDWRIGFAVAATPQRVPFPKSLTRSNPALQNRRLAMPIINPGTEVRHGATVESATIVADRIASKTKSTVKRAPKDDGDGWFGFEFRRDGRLASVTIPGDDPDQVCANTPWVSRRLYVEGSSWLYGYALNAIERQLSGEEN